MATVRCEDCGYTDHIARGARGAQEDVEVARGLAENHTRASGHITMVGFDTEQEIAVAGGRWGPRLPASESQPAPA
jgi:hypothetical protein